MWRERAERDSPSPKNWMGAYLPVVAITGNLRLVTLDKDFRNFESAGLDLLLLSK